MSFQSVQHGNEAAGRMEGWNGPEAVWTGTVPWSMQHELETESDGQFVRAAEIIIII